MYIKMITKLLEDGYAYISDGNVYYDTSKFPNYYELSGRNSDDLMVAVRDDIEVDKAKKNPLDYGLLIRSLIIKSYNGIHHGVEDILVGI